jgi:RNA-directed DNA polymerase
MLERLANSQEQTVWYSLWDKVWDQDNLNQAILKVILNKGGAGVDNYTTEQLKAEWTQQCTALQEELKSGGYRPRPARRAWIPKLGSAELRPLGIPVVRDRVVETALRAVLEPIFERDFAEQSYGFRPERSALNALERVETLLRNGYTWIVDADLKAYFDTIPHERLMQLVRGRIADGKVLRLLEQYLKAGVMDSL